MLMAKKQTLIGLKSINPLDLAITIGIFEFCTILIIAILGTDLSIIGNLGIKARDGLIVGLLGGIVAAVIFNLLNRYTKFTLRLQTDKHEFRLKRMDVFMAGTANAVFLMVLFIVESILSSLKTFHIIIGNALTGFIAATATIIFLIAFYDFMPWGLKVGGRFETNAPLTKSKKKMVNFKLIKLPIFTTAFAVGLFELFILPLIAIFSINVTSELGFALAGLIAGFCGTVLAALVFNRLNFKINMKLIVRDLD